MLNSFFNNCWLNKSKQIAKRETTGLRCRPHLFLPGLERFPLSPQCWCTNEASQPPDTWHDNPDTGDMITLVWVPGSGQCLHWHVWPAFCDATLLSSIYSADMQAMFDYVCNALWAISSSCLCLRFGGSLFAIAAKNTTFGTLILCAMCYVPL